MVAIVFACIWQHRAASAARALGIASRRSPAWGVGSWFVPVVNLWMPYTAVRDCLPPGIPTDSGCCGGGSPAPGGFVSLAASITALISTGPALVLSIPAALASLAVIAWAPGIVMAIAASHQQLMARQARKRE